MRNGKYGFLFCYDAYPDTVLVTESTHFSTYHLPYAVCLQTELLPPVVDVAGIS